MFSEDFWPTRSEEIERMLQGFSIEGKVCFDPEGGKGNIVDYIKTNGAKDVISCEINQDLRKILSTKCRIIANDFLTVTSDMISHVDFIIMNPPFSADEKHILHAFDIAPAGCNILSLANLNTVERCHTEGRKRLRTIINNYGSYENWGECFSEAERKTNVDIAYIKIQKPGESYNSEFNGFFLEDEPEEVGENGLMSYNFVRDLVNRYVAAVKIYDEQLNAAVKMNQLTSGFYSTNLAMSITEDNKPVSRNEFKKEMQKAGWKFVFEKMNMQKYATKGLKEDINKFVEQQTAIPFTMKNIYKMLEIVTGTTSSRMDRALLEVFDKLTMHYHENRYNVEGWKTNSHYLINQRFILGFITTPSYSSGMAITHYDTHTSIVDDFQKALCYITGKDFDSIGTLWSQFSSRYVPGTENDYPRQYITFEWGQWYEWGFFKCKGYKKGSMHFEFLNIDVWGRFCQHISRLKGYPLFEFKQQTDWQKRQNKKKAA